METPNLPEARVYDTGTNTWESHDTWPPAGAELKKLAFSEKGRLLLAGEASPSRSDFDEYVSDPAKPVPYSLQPNTQYDWDYFVEDQRFASSRPDVLVYTSDPLLEDLRVAGPITAELFVSTTGRPAKRISGRRPTEFIGPPIFHRGSGCGSFPKRSDPDNSCRLNDMLPRLWSIFRGTGQCAGASPENWSSQKWSFLAAAKGKR